ncbi:hypothetical protein [Mesobacillus boroniphilus]|uniref:Uncharacterized protein n=1 Tax=Mesobacillus boroniphilus JCM 21738 TaxID=1294265 RepID=W4RMN8_9BACI|nr:hypothetical protein [Mesobacillus boroniphilus]GAE44859.1 hypothetical protein JCM21738_1608 [Mesobacillus boroniphilus JCM 21738]
MVVKSAMRFITVILQYIAGVLLFILVGSLPVLMRDLNFDSEGYFHTVRELTVKIFTLSNLTYNGEREMLPAVMERFFYSMKTLGTAFLAALAVASCFLICSFSFLKRKKTIF